jgi:hypothetical protein
MLWDAEKSGGRPAFTIRGNTELWGSGARAISIDVGQGSG